MYCKFCIASAKYQMSCVGLVVLMKCRENIPVKLFSVDGKE